MLDIDILGCYNELNLRKTFNKSFKIRKVGWSS